jgi:hypothetical protein
MGFSLHGGVISNGFLYGVDGWSMRRGSLLYTRGEIKRSYVRVRLVPLFGWRSWEFMKGVVDRCRL